MCNNFIILALYTNTIGTDLQIESKRDRKQLCFLITLVARPVSTGDPLVKIPCKVNGPCYFWLTHKSSGSRCTRLPSVYLDYRQLQYAISVVTDLYVEDSINLEKSERLGAIKANSDPESKLFSVFTSRKVLSGEKVFPN